MSISGSVSRLSLGTLARNQPVLLLPGTIFQWKDTYLVAKQPY